MLIRRTRSNIHIIDNSIFIYPGINFVKDDKKSLLNKNASFKEQKKCGYVSIVDKSEGSSFYESISKLSAAKAKEVLKETYQIDLLRDVVDHDERSTVMKVAEDQIKELKRKPDAKEGMIQNQKNAQPTFQSLGDVR